MNAMSFDPVRGANGLYAVGHAMLEQDDFRSAATVFRAMAAAVPTDERAWLALGACHEGVDQPAIAAEMYRTGEALAPVPVLCAIARSRVERAMGFDVEAQDALAAAEAIAERAGDVHLERLVRAERGMP